ncbi:hypothetical protein [Streptomyces sp. NPDC054883]
MQLLCHYGFTGRGLHRLQVDTPADNAAVIGAADARASPRRGALRRAASVSGAWLDEVILGLPVEEWRPLPHG